MESDTRKLLVKVYVERRIHLYYYQIYNVDETVLLKIDPRKNICSVRGIKFVPDTNYFSLIKLKNLKKVGKFMDGGNCF